MDCKDVRNNLMVYADGELKGSLVCDIDEHLERCPGCRSVLAREQHLTTMLTATAGAPVSDVLASRIMVQARTPKEPAEELQGKFRFSHCRSQVIWQRVAAAAVLVIGLTAGGYMGRNIRVQPAATPEMQLASQVDPVGTYKLDYLSNAPQGSLQEVFLNLAEMPEESRK
ncbi:MAG: hypothetical protein GY869_09925 [Planctomycetes bacterium]|nr:hypothetical protein [Planctomycetota bacterium]